jgi:hypothetical protein
MTEQEAQYLCELVIDQYGPGSAHLHRIGNGELVVIITAKKGPWFCWSFKDWTTFRKDEKHQAKAKRRERHYEEDEDLLGSINPSEEYHLVMS